MKQIGYIESKYFPPLAVLYKGVAIHPFRIYSTDGIVLFLSDFIVPPNVSYDMTKAIVDWMERNNSKELITFNSMVVMRKKSGQCRCCEIQKMLLKRLEDMGLPILPFGNINGLIWNLA